MRVIGITGKSGSGKSCAMRYMASKGVTAIDGDRISREIYVKGSPVYDALVKEFGDGILDKDGEISRGELAKCAFSSQNSLDKLNKITHPAILAEIEREIAEADTALVAVEGAALIESGFWFRCDICVAVVGDAHEKRIKERDSLTDAEAKRRLLAQKSDSFYTDSADYVLVNNSTLEHFYQSIDAFLKEVGA